LLDPVHQNNPKPTHLCINSATKKVTGLQLLFFVLISRQVLCHARQFLAHALRGTAYSPQDRDLDKSFGAE
jgi:hypothetical protein